MTRLLLAVSAVSAVLACTATAATTPPSPCKTLITPAFIQAVTGVAVTANPPQPKSFDAKTNSFDCTFGTGSGVHSALEASLARYPVGSKTAAKFFAVVVAGAAKAAARADTCWKNDQLTYPDALPQDCTWTPVPGPWVAAAVFADQMYVEFPHAMMYFDTAGPAQTDPTVFPPRHSFTYDQLIALAKAEVPKLKP